MKNRRKGTTVPTFPHKWAEEDVVSKGRAGSMKGMYESMR
jgi:hypothetical protein